MADGLAIRATEQAEATFIAEALKEFEARIDNVDDEWLVVVPAALSRAATTAVLNALKACLENSEISSVRVTLDGRTYVMERAAGVSTRPKAAPPERG